MTFCPTQTISNRKLAVIREALRQKLITDETPVVGFMDMDGLQGSIENLKCAFPEHFFHTVAVKANSMVPVLRFIRSRGLGAEVASIGEIAQAEAAGFAPRDMVFDEPAKTRSALHQALEKGININIDNFCEFEFVAALVRSGTVLSRIGLRINPQVGSGSITAMSTATATSKFGIPIRDPGVRDQLIALYAGNPWLNSIHTHVGSQGCPLSLMVEGIRVVFELAEEINAYVRKQQITTVDIGGGLSVNFESEEVIPRFSDYAAALEQYFPILFTGKYRVITEFGRSILAKNGFIMSRVEYAKVCGGQHIAITHAGAQIATRTVFMSDAWPLRITAHHPDGEQKTANVIPQDIAGPCCFAGDRVAQQRALPLLERGDVVVLHDTGAYNFSNPFYYNSLPAAPVYGVNGTGGDFTITALRRAQSLDEMIAVIG